MRKTPSRSSHVGILTAVLVAACGGDPTTPGAGGAGGSGGGDSPSSTTTTSSAVTSASSTTATTSSVGGGTTTSTTSTSSQGGGGSGGAPATTVTSTAVTSTTATTSSGGTGTCVDSSGQEIFEPGNACGDCAAASCCGEAQTCIDDIDCLTCVADPNADPSACAADAKVLAFEGCLGTQCSSECGGGGGGLPDKTCGGPATPPSGGTCVGVVAADPKATSCTGGDIKLERLASTSCEECIETKCCTAIDACLADADCKACFDSEFANQTACQAAGVDTFFADLNTCIGTTASASNCVTECSEPNIQCNPLTNAGCVAGEICYPDILDPDNNPNTDNDVYLGYQCFLGDDPADPNDPLADQACGDACGAAQGACAPGNICTGATGCYEFCCTDADCGGGGTCGTLTDLFGGIGLCFVP